MENSCRAIVELLLSTISNDVGADGLRHSFMYGKPGAPHYEQNIGTQFFVSHRGLAKVALFARTHAHPYLRDISLKDVRTLLTDFLKENFYVVGKETLFQRFSGSYDKFVSDAAKQQLTDALAQSRLFVPETHVTMFPLVCIDVEEDYSCGAFFFCAPSRLPQQLHEDEQDLLAPESFPPITLHQGRREQPTSWLGVRSPAYLASTKMKAAILGAAALAPAFNYRYLFSGRAVFGGRCTFENGWATQYGDSHTPPLMENIIIRKADHAWLALLALKLSSDEPDHRREMRGLEYFYRAWAQDPPERFALLCMALDAVYDKKGRNTQSIADGVRSTLGDHIRESRLKDLLKVRGAVIHGRAPNVYDAEEYASYYASYGDDPIDDLAMVVAACFRKRILNETLTEHPDPNAAIVEEMRQKRQWPARTFGSTIFEIDEAMPVSKA